MINTNIEIKHYIANEGKIFKRISDQIIFGKELYLGYTYYIDGQLLEEPLLEKIEDYEQIDEQKEEILEREGK